MAPKYFKKLFLGDGHGNGINQPGPAAAVAVPADCTRRVFGSMRFKGGIPREAKLLQAELAKHGATLVIIDMSAGGDIGANFSMLSSIRP